MILAWAEKGWEDYIYWQQNDKKRLKRINTLVKDIRCQPCAGMGNPEPLKHNWSGYRSRRIDREHRLVYKVTDDAIVIAQCRYHY